MKTFIKKLPIEIYALLVPSLLMMFGYAIWIFNSTKQVNFLTLVEKLNFMALVGGAELNGFFVILWVLIALYVVTYPLLRFKKATLTLLPIVHAIKSLFAVNVFASITAFMLGLSFMSLFYGVSGSRVLEFTLAVDKIERWIFGGLPAIELINFLSGTVAEAIILHIYFYFTFGLLSMLIILAFLHKNIFRQTVIAFFLASIISIPIFAMVPVISPDGLYVAGVFNSDTVTLPAIAGIEESPLFSSYIAFFHDFWVSDDHSFYSVSSLPSLHAAWGLLAVLGIFKARRKFLSIIFALWLVFNCVGTFYSLQHYALDTLAGLLFGLVMFYLAGKLMILETKYYKGKDWYHFCDFLANMKWRLISSPSYLKVGRWNGPNGTKGII